VTAKAPVEEAQVGSTPESELAIWEKLAQQALDITAIYRLRGSDAIYAAAARRFACPLVTLDQEQHDLVAAAPQAYYPVELLTEL